MFRRIESSYCVKRHKQKRTFALLSFLSFNLNNRNWVLIFRKEEDNKHIMAEEVAVSRYCFKKKFAHF